MKCIADRQKNKQTIKLFIKIFFYKKTINYVWVFRAAAFELVQEAKCPNLGRNQVESCLQLRLLNYNVALWLHAAGSGKRLS